MRTSRGALDRLLDPGNASVTPYTMTSAARALGARLDLRSSRVRARAARSKYRSRSTRAATAWSTRDCSRHCTSADASSHSKTHQA